MEPRIQNGNYRRIIKTYEVGGLVLVNVFYAAKTNVPSHSHQHAVFCVGLTGMCSETYAGTVRQYEAATVQYLHLINVTRSPFPSQTHALSACRFACFTG